MKVSNLFNFVLGVLLAIALIVGAGALVIRYFVVTLTAPPPKPIFANERTNKPARQATAKPKPKPASATPTPTPSPSPALPPGAYPAVVTQPIGLILRDGPNSDAAQIGGIENNQRVIVLETSSDQNWQRVRVEGTSTEGWVKAGNTEKASN